VWQRYEKGLSHATRPNDTYEIRTPHTHTHLRDSEVGIVYIHLHLTPLKDEEVEIGNDRAAFLCTHRPLNS